MSPEADAVGILEVARNPPRPACEKCLRHAIGALGMLPFRFTPLDPDQDPPNVLRDPRHDT